jgi:hypothetical protein
MTKRWRDVLQIHPAAELFPLMTPDELHALGEDIKRRGGVPAVPLVLWEAEKNAQQFLLDGRNRLDAMEAAGLPVLDKDGKDLDWNLSLQCTRLRGGDPYAIVVSTNIHRRHLTGEHRRELIAKLIDAQPQKSDRQIAETVNASHHTVGSVRSEMERRGQIAHVPTRTDTKGRKQPAKKAPTSRPKPANKPKNAPADSKARDDIGPASAGEAERLRVRVEELQADKRRLEMKVAGLESKVEEAKAAAKSAPESKTASRCSICHEKKQAVLRPVFICDNCVDIYEVREAAPPDDGLDIPQSLRREPAR